MAKPWGIACVLCISMPACASAALDRRAELDRAFACIQIHEAQVWRARDELARDELECAHACASAGDARVHSARLCRAATQSADADALERCRRARETTASIEARANERCACARR